MGASDLRVTVDSAKLRCVLDPALALGHALGPRLALGLTRSFETWLTRSFWQLLDASDLLLRCPLPADAAAARPDSVPLQPMADAAALVEWTALRDGTDAGSWRLRWVGDCLAESQLQHPEPGAEGLVERFEWLAAGLAARDEAAGGAPEGWRRALDPQRGALDALALSAALDGAIVLCAWPAGGALPAPVRVLSRLDLPARAVADEAEGLFAAERALVRQLLAAAGLAPLAQAMGRLAVVHALALPLDGAADGAAADPWQHASAWWYGL